MNTKTIKRRARTATGHYKSDDPKTPDVNEAWEVAEKPKEKVAPVQAPEPEFVWFESRNTEPSMFEVAGISPIRNFSNGRLEYRVEPDDADRFSQNHFVMNGRIVRK